MTSHRYDAIKLYDLGWAPRLVPVTPPNCEIAPTSKIRAKDRGKAPGQLTPSGWSGVDVNNPKFRLRDYADAKLWDTVWTANVGFVAGDGFVIVDNDQGGEFSQILQRLLPNPLRRYVLDPKHERDAFFVRVVDFVGDPVDVANAEMSFRKAMNVAKLSILARGKQAVIAGVHPGTGTPYVWSRELSDLDHVPVISEERFQEFLHKLVTELELAGWVRDARAPAPVSAVPAAVPAKPDPGPVRSNPTSPMLGHNHPPSDLLSEAKSLLDEIPNRDLAPGELPTPVDDWLDTYVNWISVAYALIAHLGASAVTPEAQNLWIAWSDGRIQKGQSSESVWRSALAQPTRFGSMGLVKLVRSLVQPRAEFPDLDPNDPMLAPDPEEPKAPPRATPIWDRLRARWAFSKAQGFVDMLTGRTCAKQSFADGHAYLAKALRRELGLPKDMTNAANMFLRQPDHVEVFDITYAPGDPTLTASRDPAMPSFNHWKATTSVAALVTPSQIQKWLDHLTFVLGTSQERDRFLRWCAFVVQRPGLKPNWHFLVISDAGLGKDTMTAPVKLAVGKYNHADILSYALTDTFNDWAERKLIIVGEVAQTKTGLNSPTEVNNRLKPLLAAPPETLRINNKNTKVYEIPNRCAVILFSNSQNPLHLERFSRRVHVVNRLGAQARGPDYYKDIHDWLDAGGAELCASYLLTYPLTDAEKDEFTASAPATDDKDELESQNVHPHLSALEDLIEDARAGIKDGTPWPLVTTVDDLCLLIKAKGMQTPSSKSVRAWLLDMERRGTGVRRCKVDPQKPLECAVVATSTHAGRLWLLADKTPDGRLWSALTTAEIIALWKNLPPPKNATIIKHPKAGFPDDAEEPV